VYHNFVYKTSSEALPSLLNNVLTDGQELGSRAGRVKELTHVGITLTEPWKREILVSGRNPNIAGQIAETAWLLHGGSDIGWLANYMPRVTEFSDDGKSWRAAYGKRIRAWETRDGSGDVIDQLRYVVETLKSSAVSRQAVMAIWDPAIDTNPGKDIPCNDIMTFSSRLGKLDMHVFVRSNDAIWGWSGINAFEWSVLQEVVANLLGVGIGSLHFSTTSFHVYDRHWDRAARIVESNGYPVSYPDSSPAFSLPKGLGIDLDRFDQTLDYWFQVEKEVRNDPYSSSGQSVVDDFPEPMLRSWLRVLQWWWSGGERKFLDPLNGTRLEAAARFSITPPARAEIRKPPSLLRLEAGRRPSDFIRYATRLHNEKDAAYGDSWKRRGEMLGIMANIARKIDRLGGSATSDETSADTALDLFVYLAKYSTWLEDQALPDLARKSDTTDAANAVMAQVEQRYHKSEYAAMEFDPEWLQSRLTSSFDGLEEDVANHRHKRFGTVQAMLLDAYFLARGLWEREQVLGAEPEDDYLGADSADRDQLPTGEHA
jgi:thymidylate synthase